MSRKVTGKYTGGDECPRFEGAKEWKMSGTIEKDPQFVSAKEYDFRLKPGSPCVDAGAASGAPFLGKAADIGAFEIK